MDLVTALRLMARRWVVVVPVLLLTVAAVFVAASRVAPSFQARGSILVLPVTSEGASTTGQNPYSEYGGQRLAVSHLVSLAGSASFARQVVGVDSSASFELTPQADVGLIDIVVTGPSGEATIATMTDLVSMLEDSLANLQEEINAPESTWVEMRRLDTPEQAEQLAGSRNRVIVAVSGAGLLAAVGAAFALEGLIGRRASADKAKGRRRRRRGSSRSEQADDADHLDDADDAVAVDGRSVSSIDAVYEAEGTGVEVADPESVSPR